MSFLKDYIKTLKNLPPDIIEAEVNVEVNQCYMIKVSNNNVIENSYSNLTEIFARASGEKTGFAYTQDLDETPEEVIQRAYENSLESGDIKKNHLNKADKELTVDFEKSHIDNNIELEEMKNAADLIEGQILAAHESIVDVIIEARVDISSSRVINSFGLNVSSDRKVHYVNIHVTAEYNNSRYNAESSYSAGTFKEIDLELLKGKIIKNLESQFDATNCTAGKYATLLDNSVGVNIMMTAWQLFSGLKYNEGSTALSGKLNSEIGSRYFTVYDNALHQKTGYKYSFDCEGTASKSHTLVENGHFTGLLHNISTAEQLHTDSTGNAGRYALLSGTIPTDIIITPKILYIEQGDKDVDTLLAEMQQGIYIAESYDVFHSINIASGSFSIPCRGTIIKNGKKTQNITEFTISGNLLDLFHNIIGLGNDLYIEEFLKKSYCIGSPSLLIKKLQIN